jgi:hypothetical protein
MTIPQLPSDRWSIDFAVDQFIDGGFASWWSSMTAPRECLAPGTPISGIGSSASSIGRSSSLVSPGRSQVTTVPSSPATPFCAQMIAPGRPAQNAFAVSSDD